jgi:hypothetical protein
MSAVLPGSADQQQGADSAASSSNSEAAMSERLQQLPPAAFLSLLRAAQAVTDAASRRVALVADVAEDVLRGAKAPPQ